MIIFSLFFKYPVGKRDAKAFPGTWQVATEKKKAMLMQAFCMPTWWITGLAGPCQACAVRTPREIIYSWRGGVYSDPWLSLLDLKSHFSFIFPTIKDTLPD